MEQHNYTHITHNTQRPGHVSNISVPYHVTQLGGPRHSPPPPNRLCSLPFYPVVPLCLTRGSQKHHRHPTPAHTLLLSPPSPRQVHNLARTPPQKHAVQNIYQRYAGSTRRQRPPAPGRTASSTSRVPALRNTSHNTLALRHLTDTHLAHISVPLHNTNIRCSAHILDGMLRGQENTGVHTAITQTRHHGTGWLRGFNFS